MRTLPMLKASSTEGFPVEIRKRPVRSVGRSLSRAAYRAVIGVGRIVDVALSVPCPGWAVKRAHHRNILTQTSGQNFDAIDQNRLTSHRISRVRDPDSEINGKLSRMRANVRDQVRNNSTARNLKRTHTANVIGDADVGQGISISPSVLLPGENKPDVKINNILKAAWRKYRDKLEYATGRQGFSDLLTTCDGELTETGEVLALLHTRPSPGSDLPFSVELLEADRLPTNNEALIPHHPWGQFQVAGEDGMPILDDKGEPITHFIKHGIEYDQNRQIVAYHILEDHPGSEYLLRTSFRTRRVLADKVIHYFKMERAEQTRGVSFFVACLACLADLRDLVAWELVAAKAQATFGMHFNTAPSGLPFNAGGGTELKDQDGNPVTQLQAGLITQGGQKAEFYQGTRPGATFLPFFQSCQRLAGAGFGIGYSATAKDYSQGAYSALRQEDNEDGRFYRSSQGLHVRHFCRRVWRHFVQACAAKGIIPARDYQRDPYRYSRCEISVPGRKHINPLQEIMAEIAALGAGLKSFDETINASGIDPEDRLRVIAAHKKLAEDLNLVLPWAYGVAKPAAAGGSPAPASDLADDADKVDADMTQGRSGMPSSALHAVTELFGGSAR